MSIHDVISSALPLCERGILNRYKLVLEVYLDFIQCGDLGSKLFSSCRESVLKGRTSLSIASAGSPKECKISQLEIQSTSAHFQSSVCRAEGRVNYWGEAELGFAVETVSFQVNLPVGVVEIIFWNFASVWKVDHCTLHIFWRIIK